MSERITRRNSSDAVENDLTDWDRIGAMTDEDIAAAIADDPDWAPFQNDDTEVREIVLGDGNGRWTWRMIARDGEALASSPEAYSSQADAIQALARLRDAIERERRRAA